MAEMTGLQPVIDLNGNNNCGVGNWGGALIGGAIGGAVGSAWNRGGNWNNGGCCCSTKQLISECCCETNRNIERQGCETRTAIHAEGEATRALISKYAYEALQEKLCDAKAENAALKSQAFSTNLAAGTAQQNRNDMNAMLTTILTHIAAKSSSTGTGTSQAA